MMFAKSEAVAEWFRANWSELTEKTYVARVEGELSDESGVFESYLQEDADGYRVRSVRVGLGSDRVRLGSDRVESGEIKQFKQSNNQPISRFARTEWKKLSVEAGTTLVEVKLKTGRKNQIRVHFAEAGHPVIGDEKYGGEKASRLYLHAQTLRFRHPRTGEWLEFTATPPRGFG